MKKIFNYLRKLISRHTELITLPIALVLWMLSVPILRWLDPTAAVFDAGVFQVPLFAIIQLLVFLSVAWIILQLIFGSFYKFLIQDLKSNFEKISPWQKSKLAYFIYFFLVGALVFLAKSAL